MERVEGKDEWRMTFLFRVRESREMRAYIKPFLKVWTKDIRYEKDERRGKMPPAQQNQELKSTTTEQTKQSETKRKSHSQSEHGKKWSKQSAPESARRKSGAR